HARRRAGRRLQNHRGPSAKMTLMSLLWAIAFGICPQRPSHTLFLGGQPMPIEARMAGMFGGFLLGAAYFWAVGRGRALRLPGRAMTVTLIGFIVLLGADGSNALFFDLRLPHLYTPYNPLRLATGLLTGLAFAGFVIPAFNSTIWRTGLDASPLTSIRDLVCGLVLEAVYFVTALSGAKVLLIPVSLIAVLGVPVLMGMIGTVILALVTKRANQATHVTDVLPLALGGLMMAAGMLAMTGGLRYALFGAGPLELPQ
ncbi:MAG: DUF2085 domain-containing protein, partial [Anaerolineales bacterium]